VSQFVKETLARWEDLLPKSPNSLDQRCRVVARITSGYTPAK
jgi:hypothetical protein